LHTWCENCREAKEWREREAQRGRAERVVCSACDVRDAVKERIEKMGRGRFSVHLVGQERKHHGRIGAGS